VPAFATVGEADAYNAAHLFGAAWAPLTNDIKTAALYTATQLINQNVRLAVVTDGSVAIPQSLKNATSEYARVLATDTASNPAEAGGTEGMKSLAVGSIKLEFSQPSKDSVKTLLPYVIIPPHVLSMIAHLIVELVLPKGSTMMPVRNV
jgi:hypothetical protein